VALEGTGLALRRESEREDQRRRRNPRISDLAIIALAVIWLQKQPGLAEGELFTKRRSSNAAGRPDDFHERATWAPFDLYGKGRCRSAAETARSVVLCNL
jgi:hypothetical protein